MRTALSIAALTRMVRGGVNGKLNGVVCSVTLVEGGMEYRCSLPDRVEFVGTPKRTPRYAGDSTMRAGKRVIRVTSDCGQTLTIQRKCLP